jgi:hypothetical protein
MLGNSHTMLGSRLDIDARLVSLERNGAGRKLACGNRIGEADKAEIDDGDLHALAREA